MVQGKLDEALGHFQEVRRIKGDWPEALAAIACILATHPDDQKRDPKQAIALGEYAVESSNYRNPRFLDILAMAYASEGRFALAVTTAQRALSLVSAARADKQVKAIQRRLELYKRGKSGPRTGKRHSLGYFTDEKEAARAYDKKAKELFGEFAYLNFPQS